MTRRRIFGTLAALVVAVPVLGFVAMKTPLLLSDIRSEPLGTESAASPALAELESHHGGAAAWRMQGRVRLHARGDLPYFPVRWGFDVSESVEVTIIFDPTGEQASEYVIESGGTIRSGTHRWSASPDEAGLLVDSVVHLFTLSITASEVPVRRGLPAGTWRGEAFKRVFATWGDVAPHMDADQIILWVRDGRLKRFDTTGRSIAPFILARVEMEGEVALGSFRLPQEARVNKRGEDGQLVHGWTLIDVEFVD